MSVYAGRITMCIIMMAALTSVLHAGPVMECDEGDYDFGELDNTHTIKHDFLLRNSGDAPLTIKRIVVSCGGCATVTVGSNTIQPGASTTVTFTLPLTNMRGVVNRTAIVISDDAKPQNVALRVHGTVFDRVAIDPMWVSFPRIVKSEHASQIVQIRSHEEGDVFQVVKLSTDNAGFNVELLPQDDPTTHRIRVSTTSSLDKPGPVAGKIHVITDHKEHREIVIPIYGKVVGAISVYPEKIIVPPNINKVLSTRYIDVSPGNIRKFKVLEVVVPLPSMEADVTPKGSEGYLIRIGNIPSGRELNGKDIIIKTDLPDPDMKEIRVPCVTVNVEAIKGSTE